MNLEQVWFFRRIALVAMAVAIAGGTSVAEAAIAVSSGNYFGSRMSAGDQSAGDQMTASGAWEYNFQLTWNISPLDEAAGYPWKYEYVISGITEVGADGPAIAGPLYSAFTWNLLEGAPAGLSHLILHVTEGAQKGDFTNPEYGIGNACNLGSCNEWILGSYGRVTVGDDVFSAGSSNPGFPSSIGSTAGLKVDLEDVNDLDRLFYFSFESYRQPVWGSFYSKNGGDVYAYNTGMAPESAGGYGRVYAEDAGEVDLFVAVPNSVVPEPASLAIWSLLGLVGLGIAYRRRRRNEVS